MLAKKYFRQTKKHKKKNPLFSPKLFAAGFQNCFPREGKSAYVEYRDVNIGMIKRYSEYSNAAPPLQKTLKYYANAPHPNFRQGQTQLLH